MAQRGRVIFETADLVARRVRTVSRTPGDALFVTFGSYTNDATLDRQGFAEDFLREHGHDAIHVLPRTNHWWQYPEMAACLAAVAQAAAGYPRVVTYGSSMGGYAALRFARAVGADTAIALSPQYSLDRRVAPFETRWQADVAKLAFDEGPYAPPAHAVVFYDPRMRVDAAHVDLFAAAGADLVRVGVPHARHPVGPLLAETALLKPAIAAIVAGTFDPAALQRDLRDRRRGSQHHFFTLARRLQDRRPALAIEMLRRAAAIEPESHIVSELALMLDREGRHDEAGPLHDAALTRTPHNVRAQINWARHLEATDRPDEARRVIAGAVADRHGSMRLVARTVQLRMALRRWRLGWIDRGVGAAVAAARRSPHYPRITHALGRFTD